MCRFLTYWLPPIAWVAVILSASTDTFSGANTGSVLERIMVWLTGHPVAPATLDAMNFVIRKCAHLTEYGILGALTFRALRGEKTSWSLGWAVWAIVLAACAASIDEFHQTFVPSRTGTPWDVLLDSFGAFLVQAAIAVSTRRRPHSPP